MPSNLQRNGTDLDNIFAPYVTGGSLGAVTQAATTNIQVAGSDINGRYAAAASGTIPTTATNFQKATADIQTLFSSIRTVTQVVVNSTPGAATFTLPTISASNTVTLIVYVAGGAGGGGAGFGTKNLYGGGGGGSSAIYGYAYNGLTSSNSGQTITYTVGAGGTTSTSAGGLGGSSVITGGTLTGLTLFNVPGGGGGGGAFSGNGGTAGSAGGASSTGTLITAGTAGTAGALSTTGTGGTSTGQSITSTGGKGALGLPGTGGYAFPGTAGTVRFVMIY